MSVLVVGVGNPDRGDDAVGARVVERLQARGLDGVRATRIRGDVLALLDAWEGSSDVIVVDAMRSGAAPGSVRRFDASAGELRAELGNFESTHAFDLAEAIELARSLGRLPERLVVYGVEAGDVTPGQDLSEPVARAATAVVDRVAEDCRRNP